MKNKNPLSVPRPNTTKVVVASTVMLAFISFWRAAAIVLNDLGSTVYYVGGIAEQAIGRSAPWFILGVMLFSFAVRSIYMESSSMFVRGGVYVVVRDAMGPFIARLSVSALMFDYVLTGPISSVSAGQYLGRLANEISDLAHFQFHISPNNFAVFFAAAVTLEQAIRWSNFSSNLASIEASTMKEALYEASNPGVAGNATLLAVQQTLEEASLENAELQQALAERDAAQQTVEAERQQYHTLFALAPDGYLVTNTVGVIHEANPAAARLLGMHPAHLRGGANPSPDLSPRPRRRAGRPSWANSPSRLGRTAPPRAGGIIGSCGISPRGWKPRPRCGRRWPPAIAWNVRRSRRPTLPC